jgi:DNA invertase Pin-like site-specific DNA recombinase
MNDKSEKIKAGMRWGAERGRVQPGRPYTVSDAAIRKVLHLGTSEAARKVGLSKSQYINRRRKLEMEDLNG